MRRTHPEVIAVAWIVAGLLLLVSMGGLLVVTDRDARTGPSVVDSARPSCVVER